MKIRLIAVGTKMPAWVEDGYSEYAKRLNGEITLELIEIAAGKRGKNADIARITDKEGEAMLAAIPAGDHVVALDVLGRSFGTHELATTLESWLPQGRHISLLIGGPEGLAPAALARASEKWSLSKLTLPHPLVRVLVAEQIYRAWSLLKGHPYHR